MVAPFRAAMCLAIIMLLAGCGGSGSDATTATTAPEIAGDADPEDAGVIRDWADALRSGDVEAAAEFFAIPSTAQNGPLALEIHSRDDAVRFNESLPCGARLVRAESSGDFITATFRLTERPGPGICGPGTGELAETAFVIQDGQITEWRRIGFGAPKAEGKAV